MISVMARTFFSESPALGFALVALILFMGAFAAIALRAFWTKRDAFDQLAQLPLDDGGERHG